MTFHIMFDHIIFVRLYENTPMQYILRFLHGRKNDNFQMKNCDFFLIFAQNIDCGYTLSSVYTIIGSAYAYRMEIFCIR